MIRKVSDVFQKRQNIGLSKSHVMAIDRERDSETEDLDQ